MAWGPYCQPYGGREARRWWHVGYRSHACSSETSVYYASEGQHAGCADQAWEELSVKHQKAQQSACWSQMLGGQACSWRASCCISPPKQPDKWNPWTILESPPQQLFPNSGFLLLRCRLCSSHLNLQPSAPLIGVSIKSCPKICFSSALNVFPIKSRCEKLKEQFSGLNKMT